MKRLIVFCFVSILLSGCSKKGPQDDLVDRINSFASQYPGMEGGLEWFTIYFYYNINEPFPSDLIDYRDHVLFPIATNAKSYILYEPGVPNMDSYKIVFLCTFQNARQAIFEYSWR